VGEVEHVKADLREHWLRREAERTRLTVARADAAAAEHRLAAAMRRVADAGGIITAETQAIEQLLDKLHELIPRQRTD
jgi:uncharacterized membrane protein YgcG